MQQESSLLPSRVKEKELRLPNSDAKVVTKRAIEISSNSKKYCGSPSWQEASLEPHFNIGLIIDSTLTKDAHVSAINKPASRCRLMSIVVLHPSVDEIESVLSLNTSVRMWLESNKVSADVDDFDFIGTKQDGCDVMLRSNSIHAVYVIVPPR